MASRRVNPTVPPGPPGPTPTDASARALATGQGAIAKAPLLQARSLGLVTLGPAPVTLAHGLGRVPRWLLVDPTSDAAAYRTASDDSTLSLVATAGLDAELWVW